MLIQYHVLEHGTMLCVCGYEDLYTVEPLSSDVTALRPKEVSHVQTDLHLLYGDIHGTQ